MWTFLICIDRLFFFFSSRRRHTRYWRDWSSDVCSSDLADTMIAKTYKSILLGVDMVQPPYAPHTLVSADDIIYISHILSLCDYIIEMLFISGMLVLCPLIFPVKQLYQSLGKHLLQISQQDNIILPMIVYPALITRFGVVTLNLTGFP